MTFLRRRKERRERTPNAAPELATALDRLEIARVEYAGVLSELRAYLDAELKRELRREGRS